MDPLPSTSEIVEATEELGLESKIDKKGKKHNIPKSGIKCSIEDDINSLFEAIDIRTSSKGLDALRKSALKRPMRIGSPQASGIGISEPVNLKQAFRGLCISQAAELAAAKRLSKPSGSSRSSEVGTMNQVHQKKANLLEISLVPEKTSSNQMPEPECLSKPTQTSTLSDIAVTPRDMMNKVPAFNQVVSLATETEKEISQTRVGKIKSTHTSSTTPRHGEVEEVEITACSSMEALKSPLPNQGRKVKLHMGSFLSSSSPGCRESKYESSNNACLIGPVFRNRSFMKRKVKENLTSLSKGSRTCEGNSNTDASPSTSYLDDHSDTHTLKSGKKDSVKASPISSSTNISVEVNSTVLDKSSSKRGFSLNSDSKAKACVTRADNRSRSKEKGEFSQSSISSIGEYSSSATSISDDSSLSGSSRGGSRPHMSKDLRWEAIHGVQKQNGWLGLRHFKLLKKLGCGDIGTVYLAELIGSSCLFALKVMDNEFLVDRKKLPRAQTEREILQMLDHPFLPTLFAHFTTDKYWCLLMEYCPGGDLHVLRQKQPGKCFSEQAARFYVAEVLLALEYLHMLGVVYRDLKPENVLVREDGHIMLSDFDLSLRCSVNATLLKSSSPIIEPTKKSTPCTDSSCIEPFCLDPSWQVSCFTPKLLSVAAKSRKIKSDLTAQSSPLPQLVVEPTNARSNSFVGTHEYLAPEIVKGSGHGSAVDWWTFGIFLFELLYGRTPFKGSGNEETLSNVVSQSLRFPTSPMVSFHARDLIRGLLVKEPDNRLGSSKGATEIKQHPFFEGLNWALIRCAIPPELPKSSGDAVIYPQVSVASQKKENEDTGKEVQHTEDNVEFEMF